MSLTKIELVNSYNGIILKMIVLAENKDPSLSLSFKARHYVKFDPYALFDKSGEELIALAEHIANRNEIYFINRATEIDNSYVRRIVAMYDRLNKHEKIEYWNHIDELLRLAKLLV